MYLCFLLFCLFSKRMASASSGLNDRNVNAASSTSLICTVRVEIYYSFDSFSDKREVISIRNNLVIERGELTSFTRSLSPSAAEISDCHRFWWFLLASGLICLLLLVSRWQVAWTRKESTDVAAGTCTTATMQAHGHTMNSFPALINRI